MKSPYHLTNSLRLSAFVVALIIALSACVLAVDVKAAPSVSAKSSILIEAQSGRVLYQQNAFVRMPMASTTKIMTALVAVEAGDIDRMVTIPKEATGIEGSSIYLYPGEALSMRQLIYAMMLESANDAATAIAIETAGSVEAFAHLMNRKAESLGLTATHFQNPHGLDGQEHYTTAYDLALIAAAALDNPILREICSTNRKIIPLKGQEGTRTLINHNKLLSRYEGCIGVKTGFTKKSGRCLVSAAERDGLTLIAVTLNAPDDWNDHKTLLDFGFSRYKCEILAEEHEFEISLSVTGGVTDTVTVQNTDKLSAFLPRDHGTITKRIEAPHLLIAPIESGSIVGRVIYECDGVEIAASDLVATTDLPTKQVERRSFWAWLFSLFQNIRYQ